MASERRAAGMMCRSRRPTVGRGAPTSIASPRVSGCPTAGSAFRDCARSAIAAYLHLVPCLGVEGAYRRCAGYPALSLSGCCSRPWPWRSWHQPMRAVSPPATLEALATELGLAEPSAFVATVESVRATGRLPSDYVRKGEARDLGWRPGSDLCDSAPDRTIGGDRFQNREGRLPDAPGRQWFEADLDFDCGRRAPSGWSSRTTA